MTCPNHRAKQWQSQDQNPGLLAPMQCSFYSITVHLLGFLFSKLLRHTDNAKYFFFQSYRFHYFCCCWFFNWWCNKLSPKYAQQTHSCAGLNYILVSKMRWRGLECTAHGARGRHRWSCGTIWVGHREDWPTCCSIGSLKKTLFMILLQVSDFLLSAMVSSHQPQ